MNPLLDGSHRLPIYHARSCALRIVSLPNGEWQAQRFSGRDGTKTSDPWDPLQRPTTYANAMSAMNRTAKLMGVVS